MSEQSIHNCKVKTPNLNNLRPITEIINSVTLKNTKCQIIIIIIIIILIIEIENDVNIGNLN